MTPRQILKEFVIAIGFFAPFVAIPLAVTRVLRRFAPGWLIGAISGFAVCAYWVAGWTVGVMEYSDVVSLFYVLSYGVIAAAMAVLLWAVPGVAPGADWQYVIVVYAVAFTGCMAVGAAVGWLLSRLQQVGAKPGGVAPSD